jgi:ribosomal protein S27AE
MWTESSSRSKESVLSAILNCLCPECGGVIELHSNQFKCLGRCGKQWRAIWESTKRDAAQPRSVDSYRRVRRSRS